MTCSRCGEDAAIRRDSAYYCGRCAVARDWGDIIATVQDGGRASERVVFDEDQATDDADHAVNAGTRTGDPFAE